MPGGTETNSPEKKGHKNDNMFDSDSEFLDDSSESDGGLNDGNSMKRSIVGLCFHPYYQNHICIL